MRADVHENKTTKRNTKRNKQDEEKEHEGMKQQGQQGHHGSVDVDTRCGKMLRGNQQCWGHTAAHVSCAVPEGITEEKK